MSDESAEPVNPLPAAYTGTSPARRFKRFIHATRPKFFPASVLPVIAGTAWGASVTGQFNAYLFVLALLATVCVHAASNVLNDVGDEAIGTDRANTGRIYPYTGGSRFIQMGILSQSAMGRLGIALLMLAVTFGAALLAKMGIGVLFFGLAGIGLGIGYSLGPVRLSSLGIGEFAVAIAFGVLPVTGAAWLQGATLGADLLWFSFPISAWVAAILLINEVPDIAADESVGKNTLPVRLGPSATSKLYLALQTLAVASIVVLSARGALPMLAPMVPVGLLWLAWQGSVAIRTSSTERTAMTRAIESTLAVHTIGTTWLVACALYSLAGADRHPTIELAGRTMGTNYSVLLVAPPPSIDLGALETRIPDTLSFVTQIASTYEEDSELSRFNTSNSTDWIPASAELCNRIESALELSRQTNGAFDITVGELVRLWSFGPGNVSVRVPDSSDIKAALASVGVSLLEADCTRPAVRKLRADVSVDLSASAKGWGVDLVGELLEESGIENYIVEIGGELRMRGHNADREAFSIAVENPAQNQPFAHTRIRVTDTSIATSGDYRNFFVLDGIRYSHTIDPRTGYPVDHSLASVTVLASTTERADSLATALLAMGPEEGMQFAEYYSVAALFHLRVADGLERRSSSEFRRLTTL